MYRHSLSLIKSSGRALAASRLHPSILSPRLIGFHRPFCSDQFSPRLNVQDNTKTKLEDSRETNLKDGTESKQKKDSTKTKEKDNTKTKLDSTTTVVKRTRTRKSNAAAKPITGDTVLSNTEDAAAAIADDSVPVGAGEGVATAALEKLFEGSDSVEDSVLDGFYSIKDMDGFEKWISKHKSRLCNHHALTGQSKSRHKILAMDLDNVLIARDSYPSHFDITCNFGRSDYAIRIHPETLTFLHKMLNHYAEISIYTSSSHEYANKIVDEIRERYLKKYPDSHQIPLLKVLSRNYCPNLEGERRKNLSYFGSLDNVVFVDDDPYYSMRNQNNNVIHVRRYTGDKSEEAGLMAIVPLLTFLSSVESVSDSMLKLKKVWHKQGLVKVVQSTRGVPC
ncbi:hypothetical protein MJO28_003132 [Puccinia striiformis f. sp. tritici]|uniref:Mitochondrial import inner membrane translocase subunit TIM50 n=2 Tax=Puccinia striiformis TaxID=27350 RepID=A0A2S4WIN0_9BASI|nr:hypothetical protein Pst134EA_004964 [Puccinia striiformis f. sp. tritici]KAH9471055.1 hypothetical protein Pst134EA_004964 [Puccinia striiformis f. sp. tritici]KAI7959341.1 hypothetical protein MJO28_003132 [Puccinia striiformis f. sp. tritici]POW21645.1 hypothetical protein PSHT_02165 [Puccinia striiformis]